MRKNIAYFGDNINFLVVGAGAQGAPAASILSKDPEASKIVLADLNKGLIDKVTEKIGSDKIVSMRVDAGNLNELLKAAKDVDSVVNLTLPQFNLNVMEAALKNGAHYVDAYVAPTIRDQIFKGEALELDKEFKKAGLTAVIGCGATPGVTNVLARHGCDMLDKVDEVRTIAGYERITEEKNSIEAWDPGWSPPVAIDDWVLDAVVFEDGEYKHYPAFSGVEEYELPDPMGKHYVCLHLHDEAVTIPRFIGKGIRYADFKYSVDEIAGALVKLGLAGNEPVDVKGAKVIPRDVLLALVHQPVNSFLTEDENSACVFEWRGFLVIEIRGEKAGDKTMIKLIHNVTDFSPEERLEMFRKLGTTRVGVAAPAVVAAKMSLSGNADRGVIAPECLNPAKFLSNMSDMGVPIRFEETLSKTVYLTCNAEGRA